MDYQQLYNYFYSVGKSAAFHKIAAPYDINKRRELIEKAMPQADSATREQMVNNPNLTDEHINSMYTSVTGESPDKLNQNLGSRVMSGPSGRSANHSKYDINKRMELIEKAMPQADSAIRDQLINDPNLSDEHINSMYTRTTGESPDMLNQNLGSRVVSGQSTQPSQTATRPAEQRPQPEYASSYEPQTSYGKKMQEIMSRPLGATDSGYVSSYDPSTATNMYDTSSTLQAAARAERPGRTEIAARPTRPRPAKPRLDRDGFTPQQANIYKLYQQGRVAQDALPSNMRAQVAKLEAPQKLLASRGYNRPDQQSLQSTIGQSKYNPSSGFDMNSPIPNSSSSAPTMQAVQAPKVQQPTPMSTNVGSRMPSVTAPNMQKSPLQLGNSNFKSMGSGNTSTKA